MTQAEASSAEYFDFSIFKNIFQKLKKTFYA